MYNILNFAKQLTGYSNSNQSEKKKGLVILNSDLLGYGLYVRKLVKLAKELGLTQQTGTFRQKSIINIKPGELIVFGDCSKFDSFDYRVETDTQVVHQYDGRKFQLFDLVEDWNKIVKRLISYAKANKTLIPSSPCGFSLEVEISRCRPTPRPAPRVCAASRTPFGGIGIVGIRRPAPILSSPTPICPLLQALSPVAACRTQEDVTVHHNWVKIGYNQYDIYYDFCGNEFIRLGGKRVFIKEDFCGRRTLDI